MTSRSRSRGPRPRAGDLRRRVQERRELTTIYVVAEGEGTEYDYLAHLDRTYGRRLRFRIKVPPRATQRNGLHPRRVVEEAARMLSSEDINEAWALFDHDGRPDTPKVCAEARRRGVKVALSHPAFELWLLLHFENQIPAAQGGDNKTIMANLRRARAAFADYKPGHKRVDEARFDALNEDGGIARAVAQARVLVDRCPSGCGCSGKAGHSTPCDPGKRDPSTDVYLLVESLGVVPRSGRG